MDSPTWSEARPLWRPTGDVETHVPTVSTAERLARARQAGAPESQPPVMLQAARRIGSSRPRSMAPAREQEGAGRSGAAPSPRPAPPSRMRRDPGSATRQVFDVLAAAGRPMRAREVRAALAGKVSASSVPGLLGRLRDRGELVQDVVPGPYRLPDAAPAPMPREPVGTTQAILDVLAAAGRPMWPREVVALLPGHAHVGIRLPQMRDRGALVQKVERGPYSLPVMSISATTDEAAKTDIAPAATDTFTLISDASNEAEKINTPPADTHANLARLVKQLRDERDVARAELADLRAALRALITEEA